MTDKLTDKEIPDIKELLKYKAKVGCQNCDLIGKGCCSTCVNSLIKSFIELFDRLQTENERLKESATSKCEDCAGCTSWKCDCANIERVAYEKCIEKVKEEIKQALESNHKAKHEHIEKHYQCLSCDFLATVRGKIDALSGLDYFLDNLLKELVGE